MSIMLDRVLITELRSDLGEGPNRGGQRSRRRTVVRESEGVVGNKGRTEEFHARSW